MQKDDQTVKERIIQAATAILNETKETDNITVRQIAERANVGIGSINYHFKSKDYLLSVAIGKMLVSLATEHSTWKDCNQCTSKENLKMMLKTLSNVMAEYKALNQFMLTQDILNGNMQTPLYIVPVLKEIFGDKKTEIEIRIIALQMLQPLQIAGIVPSAFHMYSGFNMDTTEERNAFIDMLVDNLVGDDK